MKITFTATYGDIQKPVELMQPNGGGGSWFIMIGTSYNGQIVSTLDGLRAYPNNDDITGDDVWILLEMIRESNYSQ